MNIKRLLTLALTVSFVVFGYFVISNQQQIRDWWYLRNYEPSSEIAELANKAGLSETGREYFYVSDPELNDKQTFNENCPFEERTIVLGCYDGTRIYILEINDESLDGVETVTAAHEMLHAAYARLSSEERAEVDKLLNEQFKKTSNQRIVALVGEYDSNDKALINNELHSILPTELRDLSPELESYYDDLFSDRLKVVKAAERYESVFLQLENEINSLKSQLEGYKSQIESLETRLATLSDKIDSNRQELNQLRESDQIEEYNNRVPGFNSLVRQYNSQIAELKAAVNNHNELVKQINLIAFKHNQLVNTIDSQYQEL